MKYRVKGTNITIARYDYDEHNVNIILVSPKHLLIRNYENLSPIVTGKQIGRAHV